MNRTPLKHIPHDAIKHRRVLVTGGRGFIGSVVTNKLITLGAEVFTVGRTHPIDLYDTHSIVCDLTSMEATRALFARVRPHIVIHLASHVLGARSLDVVLPTFHSNLTSTVNLLIAAGEADCTRVLLTGSLEEPDPSNNWSIPSSPYAAAKLCASTYGRMFHALFALPVVILRVFMVYGPGQSDIKKLIPYVITSINNGDTPAFTSGTRRVDWIYVDDVAEAYVRAAVASGIVGQTIDVGSGELISVREIVERLFEILELKSPPEFGHVSDRQLEQVRYANIAKTNSAIGWQPKISLAQGLRLTVDWYCRQIPRR